MKYLELIAATTDAKLSPRFDYRGLDPGGFTVVAKGLAGTETVDVQISTDGDSTYADLYQEGSQVQLTITNTADNIVGPGMYKLQKSATAGAVSVGVYIPG